MTAKTILPAIMALYSQLSDISERQKVIDALKERTETEEEVYQRIKARMDKKFLPAKNILSKNVANNLWRKVVKEKLGIDSNMYFLKSRSANKLRQEGVELSVIKDQFRHSKETMTRIYATDDYLVRMKEVRAVLNARRPAPPQGLQSSREGDAEG